MGFTFYQWQIDAIEKIREKNAILSSPTGSGKTAVAYHWAGLLNNSGKIIQPTQKIIFTAPIKALSNERYMNLKSLGFDVGIETGDYKWNSESQIICCTQEIYTIKYSGTPNIKLVIDEFHYIFTESERARAYIDGIHKTHESADILIMSATFGNVDKVKQYLKKISKKNFIVYENNKRITELVFQKNGIKPSNINNAIVFVFSKRGIDGICLEISEKRKRIDGSKRHLIYQIANILGVEYVPKTMRLGVGPYYGRMLPKEKLLVERCYRAGIIDVIVGTDALALGLNLPAETVVFGQLAKFKDGPISKNHFLQLAGRAGRKGFYEKGFVSFLDVPRNRWEHRNYDTKILYKQLLKKEEESAAIKIKANIGEIISGIIKPNDEAKYISQFSYPRANRKECTSNIMSQINTLENMINKATGGCKIIKSKLKNTLGITWDSSLTFRNNIELGFLFIDKDNRPVNSLDVVNIFERQEKNELSGLLRAKSFIKSLGLEPFVERIEDIDYEIEMIDPTVFTFEEKNNKIDEFLIKNLDEKMVMK